MDPRRGIRGGWAFPIALLVLGLVQGCGRKAETSGPATAAADSAAYAQIGAIQDDPARFAAIQEFLKDRPGSAEAGEAWPEAIALARKVAPDRVPALLQRFLATDLPSPDPYNSVGWDLALAGENLDLAVPILVKAVAKARAEGDSLNLASCLDSEAWARYRAGDAKAAVAPMEEARALYGRPIDEIEQHMALIYDDAGMKEKARGIYIDLLGHMEHPMLRDRLAAIVAASGGSMDQVNAEINAARLAGAEPAPDFSLPEEAGGNPISLADFKGKVVLLNFWHYT